MLRFFKMVILASGLLNGSAFAFLPKSFEAKIEQEQKSSLSGTTRKSQGQMFYRYPGQMRFEIKGTDEVVFVTNGKRTWYYTGPFVEEEPGELTISDEGPNVLTKFFDSFSRGLVTNDLYTVKKEASLALVEFSKNMQSELGVKTATFSFKSKKLDFSEIQKITLVQEDQREIVIHLKNLSIDKKIDQSIFQFTAPPNTKIKN